MNKLILRAFIAFLLLATFVAKASAQQEIIKPRKNRIDLSGTWAFRIDSLNIGVGEKWFSEPLPEKVQLPGSMTTNGKGDEITLHTPWTGNIADSSYFFKPEYAKYRQPDNIKVPFWLQPVKYYKGPAWYQKRVEIPASWNNKHIEFFIERSHWETTVWVDDKIAGMQNSLAAPHVFDLTKALTPGSHIITVRVDNRIKDINFGQNSHSVTDHTQGNWNGMVGQLYLVARPLAYIEDVQLYPDIKNNRVTAKIQVSNVTGIKAPVKIGLAATSANPHAESLNPLTKYIKISGRDTTIELMYSMGKYPLLWDEFNPNLYNLNITLAQSNGRTDQQTITFGMRDFSTKGAQFTINGRPLFLRGTLECAAFPLTGYPPTDLGSWMRIFKICRSYGLNHLRFHSWCPSDAAFEAADRSGFYLHIECSSWANDGATIGDGKPLDDYIYEESRRIVKAYGNHPSFCMMDYGNEPAGKNLVKYLTDFVNYWKARDPRRLYTTASGWPVIAESNYNVTPDPRIQAWGAGLKSIINGEPPRSDYDWSQIISKWQHPTVSHEIGQWCAYPDFKEIKKYTGVLKAKNFEIFKDRLNENGMGNLADKFLFASGRLQSLCYKADIEAALRTPGFGGFQLLGLYDFPGQGTALVGVLNALWESKGYISGAEFSQFCNAVVPLVRLPKMIYLNNEELSAPVEIAQFGPEILRNVTPIWDITDGNGKIIFSGKLNKADIPFGNGFRLGYIRQSLAAITKPSRLTLTVHAGSYKNSWDIFVYPSHLHQTKGVLVTHTLDEKAIETLRMGGKVLLTLKKGTLKADKGGDIAIGFSSIFWNTAWTNGQPPVTLGILCDPLHPALKEFPTQEYSNWQWWDAMSHSNAIKLDSVAKGLQPIVRVIDDWITARSLGLIFECRVGKGKLIVSGVDLLTDTDKRPEARQLLYSLKSYMSKDDFSPAVNLEVEKIIRLYN
ncbi:MAG TPA: glycoside hydrolase family 2 TIM barrel-domain containing protein [Mucilaginibacter sp.]